MLMVERFERGVVRGFLHSPGSGTGDGVVLAHGAGGNCDAKVLVAVSEGLREAGFFALRIDLPFRQKRASGPPFPAMGVWDRAGMRDAAAELRTVSGVEQVAMGGHSYGGRMASMLAAEEGDVADALVLLSYPLHPPKDREALRTGHFVDIRMPVLFVHGTRDPFGLPDEMKAAVRLLKPRVEYSEIAGAGHDLKSGKFDVETVVVAPLRRLLER